MRPFSFLAILGILIFICSCRSDFETIASKGNLSFSRDTIFLDTVFSTLSSSTYTLKVYNQSKSDINIPTIKLGKRLNSKYRMTVDGMTGNQGKEFENITLLAKDSIYIFIETTANTNDASTADFLYTDDIEFDSGSNQQKVALVTLIKDAVFLYPQKFNNGTTETLTIDGEDTYGFFLDENDPINGNELLFTNQKPYVIYGYAAVPEGKTVTFDAGARVHFHANSGLIVSKDASLKINGTTSTTGALEGEVVFEGDRLEPLYSDIAGQWGTIWLRNETKNNAINHLTLKNATIGLLIENNQGNTMTIKNTQIYDCTNYGLLAKNAKIEGENIVINSAGQASLALNYGGDYKFTHCTFNNNWNGNSPTSVSINNFEFGATPELKNLSQATFNNCIIYGSYSNHLSLNKKDGAAFEYLFNNCLIKFFGTSTNPLYQFATDPTHYNAIILNKDPKFYKPTQNDFNIDNTSSAFAKGNPTHNIPFDITGTTRTLPPDLGAYQSKEFPKKL
ncbi:right-handed parallel beta-helix repeat-containing protein [Flavobacterium faecale]|uniref:right-handed parallel beta-helix repeat-containing protein n=1 Tax=Flavobacterium faecale TaxID=1355330 RepID=UPI003AABF4C2